MQLLRFAKALRSSMTDAEHRLWRHLRAHRFCGQKFRRQQPLGPYVVDFVHFGVRLIVEADGGQHNQSRHDVKRDAWLKAQGFHVLRFWNNQIMEEGDAVLEVILEAIRTLSPNPSPVKGEGSEGGS